ncbi:HNH endonuclease signature motif containing protein [Parafrankia sp. EUN1f]|uniref:HNH endonuclease n=1 Tax=Parafrankia sp. EUN1f TaxID=102897 RepID=UPI0001C441E2|nr:HNH endonuclease signature motif containing protein [Parafrankia sp. EUN1f]EFC86061.1 HNH endonuclease [Parafrankia sp. EUN1f]
MIDTAAVTPDAPCATPTTNFTPTTDPPPTGPDPAARLPPAALPADPDAVPIGELETAICQWAGRIAAATCTWLALLAAFDRRTGWSGIGMRSCAHWLSWRCGLSPRTAREHLATAHALEQLPAIRTAFAAGTLSYSKVRAITRVARPDTEQTWLNHAEHCTAGALEHLARAYRQRSADPDTRARTRTARRVSWHTDDDGMIHLTAVLPADQGAQLIAAIETARDSLTTTTKPATTPSAAEPPTTEPASEPTAEEHPHPEPGPEPDRQRDADGLIALAESFLHHGAPGLIHPAHTLVLHLHPTDLQPTTTTTTTGTGTTTTGDASPATLPPAVLQRLGCDSLVQAMLTDPHGTPLRLGRRYRFPTRRLRAAVHARDHGTCQYPGCDHTRWLNIHHLTGWADGGHTDLDNLTLICGTHHRHLHEEGITLRRTPEGTITALLPDGRTLTPAPPLTPGEHPTAALAIETGHVTPDAITTRNGGRLNLGESLFVLLQNHPAA